MADRRFTLGRQGEQLMNDRLFNAYNRIKYIGNGLDVPKQEYQTPILDYSLWINRATGSDILNVYNQSNKSWKTAFEGYYHPINLKEQPLYPVEGQVFIDGNGVLRYYEDKQWKVVGAASAEDLSNALMGIDNFLIIPDMAPLTGTTRDYVVPNAKVGKLFDNKKFIPKDKYYDKNIRIVYPKTDGSTPEEKVSWIHVNPAFLYGSRKRLIKVTKSIKDNSYFVSTPTTNTEFYGFMLGNPVGTLLRYIQDYSNDENISSESTDTISDYRIVNGGIQLINGGREYDFIYAITYKFDSIDSSVGSVLTGSSTIGDNNQVYVGQISGFPLVFLNGMYYEQDKYTYDSREGTLTFEDTNITNEMDLTVAAFADVVRYTTTEYPNTERQQRPPFELTITNRNIDSDGIITIQHEYLKQTKDFKHPIAFVQGVAVLYDTEYGITDEIELDADKGQIKIFNFGPIDSADEVKILVADIGDAKLSSGYTTTNRIVDSRITHDDKYLVFINGICTSPSDHEVYNGYIEIDDLLENTQYVLMSLSKGNAGIDLLFDSSIAYFTFQINDHNKASVYNDCDMVTSYITSEDGSVNGLLLDRTFIEKKSIGEETYSTGEILRVRDTANEDASTYIYKIFNVSGDYQWTPYEKEYGNEEMLKLDQMLTQINGLGSISIISNETLKGKNITYYAYTYADETDEPILKGTDIYRFAVKDHIANTNIPEIQDFYVRRTHFYAPTNKGILGTYVNGIQMQSYDDEQIECKYHIPTHSNIDFKKTWGNNCDLYNLLKAVDDNTTLEQLKQMKDNEFSEELRDYSITDNLLSRFKSLHNVIIEMETNNKLNYYVERIEQGETYSANRDWCTFANRYIAFDNTYTSNTYIGPGNVDIYLNGVMLDRSSYSIFDSCNVILNDLSVAGGSDEFDFDDPKTHRLIKYYIKDYNPDSEKTTGEVKRFYCETPDEVLIEYRPDTSLRKTSYEIKEVTYDTGVLLYDDYEFPNSLLNSKDEIKIWIDGILYTGGYEIKNKNIVLKNSPLQLDPIKMYFDMHPDTYNEWKKDNGEYVYRRSRIIFEWR